MSSTTVKGTVKDFFIYLGLALVLYTSLFTLISLCFNYIEMFFVRGVGSYRMDSIRWEISALVILFPLLIGLSYLINKDIQKDSNKLEIRSRKWLLYSVMFISSASCVGDMIFLLYSFLNGDFPRETLLKLLAVLLVAGSAFTYYYQELGRGVIVTSGKKVFSGLASLAVLVMLGIGFYAVGPPINQRFHREDERRLLDLYWIKDRAINYFRINDKLPGNLEGLYSDELSSLPKDPETYEPYEYRVLSSDSFEVCANFRTRSDEKFTSPSADIWLYRPGRNCFSSKVEQAAK